MDPLHNSYPPAPVTSSIQCSSPTSLVSFLTALTLILCPLTLLTASQFLELSLLLLLQGLYTCSSLSFFVYTHSLYFDLIVTLSGSISLTALNLPISFHDSTHFFLIAMH